MATQFGERIRGLRTKQKLLLRQVASKLDVDPSIISKIERGVLNVSVFNIYKIAKALKVSPKDLLDF